MSTMSSASSNSSPSAAPDWVGNWKVVRYGGKPPAVPTYYEATTERWTVIKAEGDGLHVAPHPILDVHGNVLVLKDEGEPDAHAERWRVEVEDDTVRVTALAGEHEGAVGVAERIDGNPREHVADA